LSIGPGDNEVHVRKKIGNFGGSVKKQNIKKQIQA
jgi:hypothetical protein